MNTTKMNYRLPCQNCSQPSLPYSSHLIAIPTVCEHCLFLIPLLSLTAHFSFLSFLFFSSAPHVRKGRIPIHFSWLCALNPFPSLPTQFIPRRPSSHLPNSFGFATGLRPFSLPLRLRLTVFTLHVVYNSLFWQFFSENKHIRSTAIAGIKTMHGSTTYANPTKSHQRLFIYFCSSHFE